MAEETQAIENVLSGEQPIEQKEDIKQQDDNVETGDIKSSDDAKEIPETNSVIEEKKEEIPSWAFNKMSKKIKTEVERAVSGAMQTVLQMQYGQQPQQQQYSPQSQQNSYNFPSQQPVVQNDINNQLDNYFAQKRQQELALKEAEKAKTFNAQVEAARDKFEDYDEFVSDAGQHFTQPMYALMTELPNSVENFKLAWDEDKSRIMNISKLSPAMQIAELKRVLDDVESRKSAQKYKSTASKPISPVRSTSSDAVKDNNNFADIVRNRYRRPR